MGGIDYPQHIRFFPIYYIRFYARYLLLSYFNRKEKCLDLFTTPTRTSSSLPRSVVHFACHLDSNSPSSFRTRDVPFEIVWEPIFTTETIVIQITNNSIFKEQFSFLFYIYNYIKLFSKNQVIFLQKTKLEGREGFEPTIRELQSLALTNLATDPLLFWLSKTFNSLLKQNWFIISLFNRYATMMFIISWFVMLMSI